MHIFLVNSLVVTVVLLKFLYLLYPSMNYSIYNFDKGCHIYVLLMGIAAEFLHLKSKHIIVILCQSFAVVLI